MQSNQTLRPKHCRLVVKEIMYPFKEKKINENTLLREFSNTHVSSDQMWHRDKENRTIVIVESGGWSFQKDNELPIVLKRGDKIKIQKEEWHRVIKGEGKLVVKVMLENNKSTIKYNANPALKGDQTKLPDALQKGIIDKSLDEDDTPHEPQYDAPQGSKRDKQLDQTKKDLKRAKDLRKDGKTKQAKELEQRAYNRRDRMEKKERKKNESIQMSESALRKVIRNILEEELSAKVKKSLDKKAEKRGFTKGSVYSEFKKGLAAYASSGSRKGMTAHQWAHARVNSATPSKPWAVVKKSKAKKKKSKKK